MGITSLAYFALLLFTLVGIQWVKHRQEVLIFSSIVFVASYGLVALSGAVLLVILTNFLTCRKASISIGVFVLIVPLCLLKINGFYNIGNVYLFAGLSFGTLQAISFFLVHREENKPFQFKGLVLYLLFFPKFLMGPIEKPESFNSENSDVKASEIEKSVLRILTGLFKKLVIADHLSAMVSNAYVSHANGFTIVLGMALFTLQLYCDFSGYSDIAIGSARLLGFDLSENFNHPFKSKSITEFWRSWHISLMSWLKEYIYEPVVYHFRKKRLQAIVLGITLTFLVSALWHGLGVNFLLWAAINAGFILLELFVSRQFTIDSSVSKFTGPVYVLFVISLANVFFLFPVRKGFELINLFIHTNFWPKSFWYDCISWLGNGGEIEKLYHVFIYLTLTFIWFFIPFRRKVITYIPSSIMIVSMALLILIFAKFNSGNAFIYRAF